MDMKNGKRIMIFTVLLLSVALYAGTGTALAKTKNVKVDMAKKASKTIRLTALSKAKKGQGQKQQTLCGKGKI